MFAYPCPDEILSLHLWGRPLITLRIKGEGVFTERNDGVTRGRGRAQRNVAKHHLNSLTVASERSWNGDWEEPESQAQTWKTNSSLRGGSLFGLKGPFADLRELSVGVRGALLLWEGPLSVCVASELARADPRGHSVGLGRPRTSLRQ